MATQAFAVTDNIWCIRRPSYLTCSYLVRTDLGIVLVDAGMDSSGNDIRQGLDAMGASMQEISAILLTHWHNDHAAGSRAIQDSCEVPAFCHEDDVPQLTRQTAKPGLRGYLSDLIPEWGVFVLFKGLLGEATPRAILNPNTVTDGQLIMKYFEVVETPGHTPGHLSFYFRPEQAMFAGDALAVVHDDVHFMARVVTPDVERARVSMRKCLEYKIDALCPGHRAPITKDTQKKCDKML